MAIKWFDILEESFPDQVLGSRIDRGETTIWVSRSIWAKAAEHLRGQGFIRATDLTAIDYPDRDPRFDLNLILTHPESKQTLRLKTMVGEDDCRVPTLVDLWKGANWWEREIFDLFGIMFTGHPKMQRLLLPSDYQGHPLRKDYPVTGPLDSPYR